MGLAGILTIALIVSADQSYAGIDGLRAITAYPPAGEQDPSRSGPIPVLTGLLDGIRELPIFAPAPAASPSDASAAPGGSVPPAALVPPGGSTPPASVAPAPSTPPPSTAPAPTPTASPVPTATPAPSAPPSAPPAPTPTPSPTPPLALTTDRGTTAAVSLGDLVPGDTVDRTITLKNTGSLGFRYTVSATQTASTQLWTDTTNGLQLTVATGAGAVLYSGPLSGLGALAGPTTLIPGGTELLRYTFAFPASAPDTLQGLLQDLTIVFTATQFP